jgi:riboflavin kinase/FMN adenylyltransferase
MTSANFHVPQAAQRGCIAIGNFDGVHKGHAVMLQCLLQLARATSSPAVAVTFDPHPIAVLRPEFTPPILTTVRERIALLKRYGADEVVVLPVTTNLLQMSAEQFFDDVVLNQFHARGIVEGPNFHFGKDRRGDVDLLCRLSAIHQMHCRIVDSVTDGSQMISSSRVRELLCSRALSDAVELLGHPYRLTGIVRRGAQRGRTIGFPTANLADIATLLPAHGVYAGLTCLEGRTFPVAVNIGPNPTFGEHREKIECHIDGYSGDLYEQEVSVDLIREVRPLQAFASVEELIRQIRSDVEFCRRTVEHGSGH